MQDRIVPDDAAPLMISFSDGSHIEQIGVKTMPRAHETGNLPPILAIALWPWIDIVETATGRMGDTVRLTAENTVANLRRRVVTTSPLALLWQFDIRVAD
ncbi:hypothetical protein [Methylobacterium sp. E-066]|uniref:hypothetical protein n=1 Tax=Methylobacterium sp. E-066 TaxID=2836584 RepID=UPI001FBC105E|nr:hypothetical protein [Methylobacterium sp. E-066]MCJ2141542.1 hypothetical protein [Methylobacterium sp. E-066]